MTLLMLLLHTGVEGMSDPRRGCVKARGMNVSLGVRGGACCSAQVLPALLMQHSEVIMWSLPCSRDTLEWCSLSQNLSWLDTFG